jgi:ketosteroid isomerase-like protein
MSLNTLDLWHRLVREGDVKGLDRLLSDDVVFYSPVVHTPKAGKTVTMQYLTAAFHVLVNESFRYVREVANGNDAVLEFQVEIDGITVNGVDMIRWNISGEIVEFKVMIRPLKAINLIQQKMAAMMKSDR